MDPGSCSYDNPISWELKGPDRHNMLVSVSEDEIPCPDNPLMADIIPMVFGNDREFDSMLNLSAVWVEWYSNLKIFTIQVFPNLNQFPQAWSLSFRHTQASLKGHSVQGGHFPNRTVKQWFLWV